MQGVGNPFNTIEIQDRALQYRNYCNLTVNYGFSQQVAIEFLVITEEQLKSLLEEFSKENE